MFAVSWIQGRNVLLVRKPVGKTGGIQDGSFPQKGWQAHPEETAAEITEAIITERLSGRPKLFEYPGR
jgi:hypothetical protein